MIESDWNVMKNVYVQMKMNDVCNWKIKDGEEW